mmetsp:Transcript_29431/g.94236  ORF Transcript_29431/g.94236 Transcript_29431/m.94236 type:complete len:101 (+) Transcript_29431:1984-2286(+)
MPQRHASCASIASTAGFLPMWISTTRRSGITPRCPYLFLTSSPPALQVDKHNKKIRHHFEVPPSEGEIGKFKVVGVVYTPPGSEIHAESMGMLKVLKEYS